MITWHMSYIDSERESTLTIFGKIKSNYTPLENLWNHWYQLLSIQFYI